MKTSKVIYREISSDRLITQQEASVREASMWQEEIFTPPEPTQDSPMRRDLPSVELQA